MKIRNQQNGFTLIEILVVIFICSFALIPALHNWHKQQQREYLIDTARQVAAFIYRHFMEGIYLNQHRILFVDPLKDNWKITIKDAITKDQIGQLVADKFNHVAIKSATRTSIDLYGKQGTSHAFRIELQNDFGQMTIFMSASGRVRGCSNKKIVGVPHC
ncbi:prepilin-type N-terminal cleavage/methylation domain-containing protein [Providencia sneebia]|uniref:Prepilin peptidase dependent protein A n=1 Tax=Providencia sneebia DSM 19967 TaxID=1141660 RepID=K8WHU9_9GAMM|nr:prepilin-type N-terminal cleavage/methylation domain-containing protein [Providencia sneebia]EKT60124.1 hypothetical protein OO7_04834 [Providencia sneebia DSM 19967]